MFKLITVSFLAILDVAPIFPINYYCPSSSIVIMPAATVHTNSESDKSAGRFSTRTSDLPPDHISSAGTHGIGGISFVQPLKGWIFSTGLLSPIFAPLEPRNSMLRDGSTFNVDFPTPLVQLIIAPSTTYDVPMSASIPVILIRQVKYRNKLKSTLESYIKLCSALCSVWYLLHCFIIKYYIMSLIAMSIGKIRWCLYSNTINSINTWKP